MIAVVQRQLPDIGKEYALVSRQRHTSRVLAAGLYRLVGLLLLVLLLVPTAGARAGRGPNASVGQSASPGTVTAWGNNGYGQLGAGTVGPGNPTPAMVPGLGGV